MKAPRGRSRLAGLALGLAFGAQVAAAEVAPQNVNGGAGMMNLNTYSAAYQPTTSTKPAMMAGIEAKMSSRWSVMLRTTSSVDETFSGAAMGVTYGFSAHKTESFDGPNGLAQIKTTVVPSWTTRLGVGLGRWQYAQVLELTDQTRAAKLRDVPVKAALYGMQMRAAVTRSLGETWALDGEYSFVYASASGFSLIVHTLSVGPSYWF